MTDDNKAANEEQSNEENIDEPLAPEEQVRAPTLAEDLADLEKLNLMRAVMLKLQGGKHPYASTDALLDRRMSFDPADFQGPYVVRLVCTLMMIFVFCSIFWVILWLLSTSLNLTYFIRLISTGLATLFAAIGGVAVFHPASLPDEKKLKEAIEERMHQLRTEIEEETRLRRSATTTDSEAQQAQTPQGQQPEPDFEQPVTEPNNKTDTHEVQPATPDEPTSPPINNNEQEQTTTDTKNNQ